MWFQSYISTILQRDIRDSVKIDGIYEIPQIFSVLGYQAGALLNMSNLLYDLGIPLKTLKRYLSLIEAKDKELIGIEVKFERSVTSKDFEGLKDLKRLTKGRFKLGYALSLGEQMVPFGNNLFTLPSSAFLGIT